MAIAVSSFKSYWQNNSLAMIIKTLALKIMRSSYIYPHWRSTSIDKFQSFVWKYAWIQWHLWHIRTLMSSLPYCMNFILAFSPNLKIKLIDVCFISFQYERVFNHTNNTCMSMGLIHFFIASLISHFGYVLCQQNHLNFFTRNKLSWVHFCNSISVWSIFLNFII